MNYNLASILEKLATIQYKEIEGNFTLPELWKWMLFDKKNSHLNTMLTIHSPSGIPIKGREIELDTSILIKGDYLLFDFIGHSPLYKLISLDSIQNIANAILSESGIFNLFTTIQTPIIKGQIYYLNEVAEFIDQKNLTEEISNQELINDFQKILHIEIATSNFDNSLKQARNCILKYKEEGLSQQKCYDIVFAIKLVYRAIEMNQIDDFIDEVLDCICGYIGNKKYWIWNKPL